MLSIIIVNFKNPQLLRLCLSSIIRTIDKNFRHELIVVDSESTLETRSLVREEFPSVRLLQYSENLGYTRGVNEGIRNSSGEYFLVLNPDIVPLKDSIESLYLYLTNNPSVGLAGPCLLNFDGTVQNSCFHFPSPSILLYRRTFLGRMPFGKRALDYFLMKDVKFIGPTPVDWLMGSALMGRREAVKKVGFMDENLFHYMNDVDWLRRFWENGYSVVYFPESKMYHYHKRGSKGRYGVLDVIFKKESRWHLKDAIKYFRKHGLSTKSFSS